MGATNTLAIQEPAAFSLLDAAGAVRSILSVESALAFSICDIVASYARLRATLPGLVLC
jgi:hypothetical protein